MNILYTEKILRKKNEIKMLEYFSRRKDRDNFYRKLSN